MNSVFDISTVCRFTKSLRHHFGFIAFGWLAIAAPSSAAEIDWRPLQQPEENDKAGAYEWELKAAQAGLKTAQLRVAEKCLEGLGTARDLESGLRWLQAASDQQLPAAQYLLAMLYACGNGEPRHANETPVKLLQLAADGGEPRAMLELARRFRVGQGVPRDYLKACAWIAQAESTGRVVRQDEQSISYDQDDAEFREFLRVLRVHRAATEGHDPESMFQLGEIARSGKYGDPDYPQSYYWHSLADRHGQRLSASRILTLKAQLTPEQIREVTAALTGHREP
ncbi:MAG: sel1 repeat family protein [Verrucomicrobia bacterium]|nr:sel1 repeat family protein [Verrucomicrobiota bacterium]